MTGPLTIDITTDAGNKLVKLAGPLTLENTFSFQAKMREGGAADTVLDITEVPYIDSAGIGCIVNTFVSCQNKQKRFVLVGPNDRVRTILQHTRVDMVFPIASKLADVPAGS